MGSPSASTRRTGREYLLEVSDAVLAARQLRYEPDELFDDLTDEELEIVVRGLRAVSWSATVGARKLAKIIVARASAAAGGAAS